MQVDTIMDDNIIECNETFFARLSSIGLRHDVIVDDDSITLIIVDNEKSKFSCCMYIHSENLT